MVGGHHLSANNSAPAAHGLNGIAAEDQGGQNIVGFQTFRIDRAAFQMLCPNVRSPDNGLIVAGHAVGDYHIAAGFHRCGLHQSVNGDVSRGLYRKLLPNIALNGYIPMKIDISGGIVYVRGDIQQVFDIKDIASEF